MISSDAKPWVIRSAGAGGLAVTTALFAVAVVGPLRDGQRRASSAAQAMAVGRQRADRTAAEVQVLSRELRRTEADVAASRLRVRPLAEVNEAVAAIVGTAADCGVAVQSVQPEAATTVGPYALVPVRLVGRCDYAGGARFLHAVVERMPDVGVRSVDLNGERFAVGLVWLATPERPSAAAVATSN